MALSRWSFFSQSLLGFFQLIATPFPMLSIVTILLDKCQTKSCFEDMNNLIKAFPKLCTSNQVFKILKTVKPFSTSLL